MDRSQESKTNLIVTYRGVIYPWHCDHMGHMNVMWYVGKFDEATWQLIGMMGITLSYMRDQNVAMVAVQQNTTYKRELLAGDLITIRSGILEMKEKTLRFCHEMRNDEKDEIAAVTFITGVHLDSQTRKSRPFPEEMRARARTMIVEYDLGAGLV